MDVDRGSINIIRQYVLEYVLGIFWILALTAALGTRARLLDAAAFVDDVAALMPHARVPDFAVGLLVLIVGVVIPYGVGAVMRSPSAYLIDAILQMERRTRRDQMSSYVALHAAVGKEVRDAIAHLTAISMSVRLGYLSMLRPEVASALRGAAMHLDFWGFSVLPVSIFIGAVIARVLLAVLFTWAALLLGCVITVVIFLAASWEYYQTLDGHYNDIDALLLLAIRNEQRRTETQT